MSTRTRMARPAAAACVISVASGGLTAAAGARPDPRETLEKRYPDVRIGLVNGRVRQVYGAPMSRGRTPQAAADAWLAEHAGVWASGPPDLQPRWALTTRSGKTIFAYEQRIGGLPVPESRVRLVAAGAGESSIVYAAAAVSPHAGAELPPARLTAADALAVLGGADATRAATEWREPSLVAHCGEDLLAPPVPAWRCVGRLPDGGSLAAYVDAIGGGVIAVHPLTVHAQPGQPLTGTVRGWALPGLTPYWGAIPTQCPAEPVPVPVPYAEVRIVEPILPNPVVGRTDANGAFELLVESTGPVRVEAVLRGPSWETAHCLKAGFSCFPGVRIAARSGQVVPPGLADVVFELPNTEPEREWAISQLNAHTVVGQVHALMDSLGAMPPNPPFLYVWVNHDFVQSCNALYDLGYNGIRTPMTSPGCPNMAYASIMAHEWGHFFAHAILGFSVETDGARSFHEGFADAMAMLFTDSPLIGLSGGVCGASFRDLSNPRCAYPACDGSNGGRCRANQIFQGVYDRAEVLGGTWWDMRIHLGLEPARQVFADWALLTLGHVPGPTGCPTLAQSAGPATLVEIAVAADDDGNLANGVPYGPEICAACLANGIAPDPGQTLCDSGPLDFTWNTIDGGGGGAVGDGYAMHGTVGQPDAGELTDHAGLRVLSGFWGIGPVTAVPCYPDCDTTTGPGSLDIFDFLCFQNRYAAMEPYACDCDTTTGAGVCDIFDFLCFQNAFAAGCR